DILAGVGRAVGSVNPELGEIFRYMQDNELYDIQSGEDGQDRMDNNYTVGLPSYGDAFIFINRNHTFTDYQSLIHEFGHFSSYYYNSVPELFQGYSVDVCEVQSQGLEMLVNQYAGDMFGEGAEAFEFETVTDMLYVIIMSCMLQEFEEAVYMDPDMSLEDMNRTFKEIQDSYHGWYFDVYDEGVCYDWVDVSHLFYSPLYYMGYGTSALSALDLWTMSRRDWDGAVDTYMGLLNEGLDAPYRDTMYRCGLRDVFDSGELEALAGDVRRIQGLEQDGEGAEDPSQENPPQDIPSQEDPDQAGTNSEGSSGSGLRAAGFLVLAGICVILVFQVMILCTGFVIIWLLVRKKREE
ncbi:M3 family metallopeptidase, partial [Enterocloster bolteae]